MRIDHAVRWIRAPAETIYRALTCRDAVQKWLPPAGTRGVVDDFEPRPGGPIRITLVFETPGDTGTRKSSENSDVVRGEFLELVPNQVVRQRFTFISDDPAFAGAMVMTWLIRPRAGGADVEIMAEHVPPGISSDDHQQGMHSSLANLAKFVES